MSELGMDRTNQYNSTPIEQQNLRRWMTQKACNEWRIIWRIAYDQIYITEQNKYEPCHRFQYTTVACLQSAQFYHSYVSTKNCISKQKKLGYIIVKPNNSLEIRRITNYFSVLRKIGAQNQATVVQKLNLKNYSHSSQLNT